MAQGITSNHFYFAHDLVRLNDDAVHPGRLALVREVNDRFSDQMLLLLSLIDANGITSNDTFFVTPDMVRPASLAGITPPSFLPADSPRYAGPPQLIEFSDGVFNYTVNTDSTLPFPATISTFTIGAGGAGGGGEKPKESKEPEDPIEAAILALRKAA